jgi:hypothetical protein
MFLEDARGPGLNIEHMRPAFEAAEREIARHAAVGPFLLTKGAIEILRLYRERLFDPAWVSSAWSWRGHHSLAKACWTDFSDRARRDVGNLSRLGYAGVRAGRWLKGLPRSIRWRYEGLAAMASAKWNESKHALFSHLSQADVRTPPKYAHWKTVEEMKRLGWSRGRIQMHLHEQLRADPPDSDGRWPPLEARTKRKGSP